MSNTHKITKENHHIFRAKALEAKARKKKERQAISILSQQLAKASPSPWLDKLIIQEQAIHETILRELQPGQGKGSWTARVMELVRIQGQLIAQREKLGGASAAALPASPSQVEPLDHKEQPLPIHLDNEEQDLPALPTIEPEQDHEADELQL